MPDAPVSTRAPNTTDWRVRFEALEERVRVLEACGRPDEEPAQEEQGQAGEPVAWMVVEKSGGGQGYYATDPSGSFKAPTFRVVPLYDRASPLSSPRVSASAEERERSQWLAEALRQELGEPKVVYIGSRYERV